MKLVNYGLKDTVSGEFIFIFQEKNEGMMKRLVQGCLLDKTGNNPFCHNLRDKEIYDLGTVETLTGEIKPITPIYVVSVQEIRLDLIRQIKIDKTEVGIEKPEADEVYDDENN